MGIAMVSQPRRGVDAGRRWPLARPRTQNAPVRGAGWDARPGLRTREPMTPAVDTNQLRCARGSGRCSGPSCSAPSRSARWTSSTRSSSSGSGGRHDPDPPEHRRRSPRPRLVPGRRADGGARPLPALLHRVRHRRRLLPRIAGDAVAAQAPLPDRASLRPGRLRGNELCGRPALGGGEAGDAAARRAVERAVIHAFGVGLPAALAARAAFGPSR